LQSYSSNIGGEKNSQVNLKNIKFAKGNKAKEIDDRQKNEKRRGRHYFAPCSMTENDNLWK
jgi:hypothetical protein